MSGLYIIKQCKSFLCNIQVITHNGKFLRNTNEHQISDEISYIDSALMADTVYATEMSVSIYYIMLQPGWPEYVTKLFYPAAFYRT